MHIRIKLLIHCILRMGIDSKNLLVGQIAQKNITSSVGLATARITVHVDMFHLIRLKLHVVRAVDISEIIYPPIPLAYHQTAIIRHVWKIWPELDIRIHTADEHRLLCSDLFDKSGVKRPNLIVVLKTLPPCIRTGLACVGYLTSQIEGAQAVHLLENRYGTLSIDNQIII
jgi:hypothetical protein